MNRFWFGKAKHPQTAAFPETALGLEALESRLVPAPVSGSVSLAPVRDLVSQHPGTFLLSFQGEVNPEDGNFLIDFGDGSPRETLAPVSGKTSLPISHLFKDPGPFQAAVSFQPRNSPTEESLAQSALEVKQVGLIPHPRGGNETLWAVGGTSNDDTIEIQALDGKFASATINGTIITFQTDPQPFDDIPDREISIKTGEGNDLVTLGVAKPQGFERIIIHDVVSPLYTTAQVDLGSGEDRFRTVPLGSVGTPRKGGTNHVDFQFVNQGSYYGRPYTYTDHFFVSYFNAESVSLTETKFVGQVASLYQSLLTRQPSPSEAVYWSGQIQRKGFPLVARSIFFSWESCSNAVKQWYQRYLGRTVTHQEASPWIGQLMAGKSMETVLAHFLASGEFVNRFAQGTENEVRVAYVKSLYQFLLEREPTQGEIATQLSPQGGTPSLRALAESFLRSAEYRGKMIQRDYETLLQRGGGVGPGFPDPSPFFTPSVSSREVNSWAATTLGLLDIRYRLITSPEFIARIR